MTEEKNVKMTTFFYIKFLNLFLNGLTTVTQPSGASSAIPNRSPHTNDHQLFPHKQTANFVETTNV